MSIPLAEQLWQRSAKPFRWVQLPHGFQFHFPSIGLERYTLVAVRKDLLNRNKRRATVMLDHFLCSARYSLGHCDTPVSARTVTGLAAAVQLPLCNAVFAEGH